MALVTAVAVAVWVCACGGPASRDGHIRPPPPLGLKTASACPCFAKFSYQGSEIYSLMKIQVEDETAGDLEAIEFRAAGDLDHVLAAILVLDSAGGGCGGSGDGRLSVTDGDDQIIGIAGGAFNAFDSDGAVSFSRGGTNGGSGIGGLSPACPLARLETYFLILIIPSPEADLESHSITVQLPAGAISSSRGLDRGPAEDLEPVTLAFDFLQPPTLLGFVSSIPDGRYGPTSRIEISAVFNKPLNPDVPSDLAVLLSNGVIIELNSVTANTLTGTYVVGPIGSGEDAARLLASDILPGGHVEDLFGRSSTAFAIPPGADLSGRHITIDTTSVDLAPPAIRGFESQTPDGVYRFGSEIDLAAEFDEPISIGSRLVVELDNPAGSTIALDRVDGRRLAGVYTVGQSGAGEDVERLGVRRVAEAEVFDRFGNALASTAFPPDGNLSADRRITVRVGGPVMGRSRDIQLLDVNRNGRIETVGLRVQNPLRLRWELYGTPPYGLRVNQGGAGLRISSVKLADPVGTAEEIELTITLDESDPGLALNTDGVETEKIEMAYAGSKFGRVRSGRFELNAIQTGDRDGTDREADAAPPVPVVAAYLDLNRDGAVDSVELAMSPDRGLSCGAAGGNGWTFPQSGEINLGVVLACAARGDVVRLTVAGADIGVTGGETEPIISYSSDLAGLIDGAGNAVAAFSLPVWDSAPPAVLSAQYRSVTGSRFRMKFDPAARESYGLAYPVTYKFNLPAGVNGLTALRRDAADEPWSEIEEKLHGDFFNGVEVARFDYLRGQAFVSVAPADGGDSLELLFIDAAGAEVIATFVGITRYYDDRAAVVVASADDWVKQWDDVFVTACQVFRSKKIWLTVGITPDLQFLGEPPDWSLIQEQVDLGWVEPAAHGMSHINWFEIEDFGLEIGGSKAMILASLVMPPLNRAGGRQFLYAWLEPYGYSDDLTRALLGEHRYLADRAYTNKGDRLARWDNDNGLFQRSYMTLELGRYATFELHREFSDRVFAAGEVLHLVVHPWEEQVDWNPGSYIHQMLDYVKEREDLWYVAFGHLYLYRFTAERGVEVEAMDGQEDMVELRMTAEKPDALACVFRPGDWYFPNPGEVGMGAVTGCEAEGDKIFLSVAGAAPGVTGDGSPTLVYRGGDGISDGSGNAPDKFKISVGDGMSP